MKLPQLFACCKAEHVNGNTQITVRSSCCNKPIVLNLSYEHDPEEVIKELVKMMVPKAPVVTADV